MTDATQGLGPQTFRTSVVRGVTRMEGRVRAAEGAPDTHLDLCKGALGAWTLGWGATNQG